MASHSNAQPDWVKAKKDNPCPACGKMKCLHGAKSGICNRGLVPEGYHDGGERGVGRLWFKDPPTNPNAPEANRERETKAKTKTPKQVHPVATSGELDRVYSRWLELCPPNGVDVGRLGRERGRTADQVTALRIGRLPDKDGQAALLVTLEREFGRDLLLKVPGILKRGNRLAINAAGPGLLIPVGPAANEPVSSLQLRLDEEPEDGGRYRVLSGGDKGAKMSPEPYVVRPEGGRPGVAILTEGWSKALAASDRVGVLAVGVPGVDFWSKALPFLKDGGAKEVLVAWDADHTKKPMEGKPPNRVFLTLTAAVKALRAEGHTVGLLLWDAAHKGVDDAILAGAELRELKHDQVDAYLKVVAELLGMAEEVADEEPGAKRPELALKKDDLYFQKQRLAEGLATLDPPAYFHREGVVEGLVTIRNHTMLPPSIGFLRSDLDERFRFVKLKQTDDGESRQSMYPPKFLLEALCETPEHLGVPKLQDFTTSPIVLADGTITANPGYYPEHLVFYSGQVPCGAVPMEPTEAQVGAALALLLEPFQDFPFVSQADRANLLGLLLIAVARPVIRGVVPAFMVSANAAGTGKGLLLEVAHQIATGRNLETQTWKADGEEFRKSLTTSLMAGSRLVCYDNVNDEMDSGNFAAVVTARTWTDRLLGGNTGVAIENRTVFLATANNPTMSLEVQRRFVTVELATTYENPADRVGFGITDLPEWVKGNQTKLLTALLTLWRAWFAAGKPLWYERKLGSFEEFSKIIGGVLDVAGVDGFLANKERVRADADTETASWRLFVSEWWRVFGDKPVTTTHLQELCVHETPGEMSSRRGDPLLPSVLGAGNDRSQASRLGRALTKNRNRVFGLYQIQRSETTRSTLYLLRPVPPNFSENSQKSLQSLQVCSEEREELNGAVPAQQTFQQTSTLGAHGSLLKSNGLEGDAPITALADFWGGDLRAEDFPL